MSCYSISLIPAAQRVKQQSFTQEKTNITLSTRRTPLYEYPGHSKIRELPSCNNYASCAILQGTHAEEAVCLLTPRWICTEHILGPPKQFLSSYSHSRWGEKGCLDVMSPTHRPRDMLACIKRLSKLLSAVAIYYGDTSTL